jgi:hypothetical protein
LNTLFKVIILATVILSVNALPGRVEEKQTPSQDSFGADVNLDKLVTYQTRGESIGIVVDALAQASGIALRAGTSSKDWEVRDRKISIFANKLPLRELMNSISRTTNFKWQISGEDSSKTYRLVWDNKSRAQTLELSDKSTTVAQATQTDQVAATPADTEFFPGYGNNAPLTPEQQANLEIANPFLAWWQKSGMAKAVGGVLNTVPGASGALSTGSQFSMSGGQLSTDGRKAVLKLLNSSNKNGGILGGIKGRGALRNIRKNLDNANISINHSVSAGSYGNIQVSYGNSSISTPLLDSKSVTANTIGKMYTQSKQSGKSMNSRGYKGDLKRAADADVSATDTSGTRKSSTTDTNSNTPSTTETTKDAATSGSTTSAVKEKKAFKLSNKPLSIELMRASRLLNVSVVSDWFGDPLPSADAQGAASSKPDEVLDDIADRYAYTWDRPSAASEFRDTDWASKSFLLLPDEWLAGFRKIFAETGTLDLPVLAQMADLSPGQFEVAIETDSVLGNTGISKAVLRNVDFLKLYATLSNEERGAVFSADALNLKSLDMGKIPLAKTAVSRNASFLEKNDIPLLLRGEVKPEGKSFTYQFTAFLDNAKSKPVKWSIQTPVYRPGPARTTDTTGPIIQTGKVKNVTPKSVRE